MNAETAGHAGTPQLKQLNMVNIEMFRHPNYYKELRKLRNKLDQAISHSASTEANSRRATGPGPKLQAREDSTVNRVAEPQASSAKLKETQASSDKPQAPSHKRQAPSRKRQAHES